jgi:hypothetical protein
MEEYVVIVTMSHFNSLLSLTIFYAFYSFDYERYPMKVISETRRGH